MTGAAENQVALLKRLYKKLNLEFGEESLRSLSVYEASLLIVRLVDKLRNQGGLKNGDQ